MSKIDELNDRLNVLYKEGREIRKEIDKIHMELEVARLSQRVGRDVHHGDVLTTQDGEVVKVDMTDKLRFKKQKKETQRPQRL